MTLVTRLSLAALALIWLAAIGSLGCASKRASKPNPVNGLVRPLPVIR